MDLGWSALPKSEFGFICPNLTKPPGICTFGETSFRGYTKENSSDENHPKDLKNAHTYEDTGEQNMKHVYHRTAAKVDKNDKELKLGIS